VSFWSDAIGGFVKILNPAADVTTILNDTGNNPLTNAIDSTTKDISSGLMLGFEQTASDIWTVIQGPIEIGLGVLLLILAFVFLFKGQILSAAGIAAAFAV
jgi:hypothetical protein